MLWRTAIGRDCAYPPSLNGKKELAAPMDENILGVIHGMQINAVATTITAREHPKLAPLHPEKVLMVYMTWLEMSRNGAQIRTAMIFTIAIKQAI